MDIIVWLISCIGTLLIGVFVAIIERLRITPCKPIKQQLSDLPEIPNVISPLGSIIASNKISTGRLTSKILTMTSPSIVKPRTGLLQGITNPQMVVVRNPETGGINRDLVERELAKYK